MSGRITDLKSQKRSNQRINVFIDGEFAFGLSRITAVWLAVGQELSDEKIAQLLTDDAREVALQRALRLLERRPHSESEIRRKLTTHKVPEEVMNDVLSRLKESGLINDEEFASSWVDNQRQFRPRGRKAMSYEMRKRGISEKAIQNALEQITTKDEEAMAFQAAQKQIRKYSHLEWQEFRRKLGAFLARRGFNYEVVKPVVEKSWQELKSSEVETTNERDLT